MEVRKHVRVYTPLETKVYFWEDKNISENLTILNLSLGGAFIESSKPYPKDTLLEILFNLPGQEKKIKAVGFVRWSQEQKIPSGMGVQFLTLSEEDQKAIKNFTNNGF